MQLIEDACNSFDEDECDETSSTRSSANARTEASIPSQVSNDAMSSKRQLQFMQMWGERRQLLTAKNAQQPRKEQQQQPPMPVIVEEDKKQMQSRTFVPSSAWRGLPEADQEAEGPLNLSAKKTSAAKMQTKIIEEYDEDEDDAGEDDETASLSEEDSNEDKEEAATLARADQIISDDSVASVQSLCEAAAAAAASAGGRDSSTDRQKAAQSGTALREPAEIATLLQNIRLGRRELYADDSYAVRLERDLRVELRTELDRQQRLDARLDSMSLGDENEAAPAATADSRLQSDGGGSTVSATFPEQRQQQNSQPSQESILSSTSGGASSLAMRIKRRIGGIGARDSGEPAPAPLSQQPKSDRLDRVAKKSLQASTAAAAARKTKKSAASVLLSRRRRDISSSSSNSTSDSSSSDSDPQVNNRCRWRKSRVSHPSSSNSNCSNSAARSESGSSCSSKLNADEAAENKLATEESNSSLPMKRPVFRAQGGSPSRRHDCPAPPAVGSRGALNVSVFEADPNQSVHLDHVYESVEQLELSGAVRIIDPRQMIADLDGGWPTEQLKSAPSTYEVSSESVAFTPKASFTTVSGLHKASEIGGSAATHPASSPTSHTSQPRHGHSNRHQQSNQHMLNQENQHRVHREQRDHHENRGHQEQSTEEYSKPHNAGNADPLNLINTNRKGKEERGRMRSQLLQLPEQQAADSRMSGIPSQEITQPSMLNDLEMSVDETAKRIVALMRSQSGQSQADKPAARSPVRDQLAAEDEDIDKFRVDSDELDSQNKRFTSGHHGRITIANTKGLTQLATLSRLATPSSLRNSTQSPAQLHHAQQKDAKHIPTEDRQNRNSSNRARRLKRSQQLKVTKLMLAMHSTEPHFMSEGRKSGLNPGATPVPRRCCHAVLVQSQPVHWDLQLRRVVVNPRALHRRRRTRGQKKMLLTANWQKQCREDPSDLSKNNSSSNGDSNFGDVVRRCDKVKSRCATGLVPVDGFIPILQAHKGLQTLKKASQLRRSQDSRQEEKSTTVTHWVKLGSLPQPQKPAVARVRRVLSDDFAHCNCSQLHKSTASLYRNERFVHSKNLHWNVSHCTETVDNPSLIPASDTEQLVSQSRQTISLPSSWDTDRNTTARTVTANSISCGSSDSGASCLSTFNAATVDSQSVLDFILLRQAMTVLLPPVLEADYLSNPTYMYCTSAIVERFSGGPNCTGLAKCCGHPRIGYSQLVYYMPNVTIFRHNALACSNSLHPHKRLRAKSVRQGCSGDFSDSVTLLVSCELICPSELQQPLP